MIYMVSILTPKRSKTIGSDLYCPSFSKVAISVTSKATEKKPWLFKGEKIPALDEDRLVLPL